MCQHRHEYRSVYGWISFCGLEAYGVAPADESATEVPGEPDEALPSVGQCRACPEFAAAERGALASA